MEGFVHFFDGEMVGGKKLSQQSTIYFHILQQFFLKYAKKICIISARRAHILSEKLR